MVIYACAFSQSELGKYFEWIIMQIMATLFVPELGGVDPEKSYKVLIKWIASGKQNQSKTKLTLV